MSGKFIEKLKIEEERWLNNKKPLQHLQPISFPRLDLNRGKDARYYLHEFDVYNDEEFIEVAYQVILGRPPDGNGFSFYLEGLRSGYLTRDQVLGALRFSPEGRSRGVKIPGLMVLFLISRARRLPVVGSLFGFFYNIATFSRLVKRLEHIHNILGSTLKAYEKLREVLNENIGDFEKQLRSISSDLNVMSSDFNQKLNEIKQEIKQHINVISSDFDQKLASTGQKISMLEDHIQNLLTRTTTLRQALLVIEKRFPSSSPSPLPSEKPAEERAGEPLSTFSYAFFEDDFRGDPEKIKKGFLPYLPVVKSSPAIFKLPVVDLGCGRGDWLRLLKEEGIHAIGVDTNEVAISFLEKEGLSFAKEDIFDFLRRSSTESFSVVTAFHVIEHLPPEKWTTFLESILRVLAPGGIAILETPNPRHLLVASGDFYRDITHIRPVFPDTLEFLGEIAGFVESTAFFFDSERTKLIPAKSVKFATLEDYLNVSRDFAWIGRKASR
ncbi:MAG: methyltransferase domain-containing protein [Thermodesulforhabdaceae bacterium]